MLSDKKVYAVMTATDLERAKKFYTENLSLKLTKEDDWSFSVEAGGGTAIYIYLKDEAPKAENTQVSFKVSDIESEVEDLTGKGVAFEHYDMPEMGIKTNDKGIAEMGGVKSAWFKDTEGNILGLNQM